MKKTIKITKIFWIIIIVLVVIVFRQWIGTGIISSGDLEFFYPVKLKEYFLSPPLSWETFRGSGLGGNAVLFQGSFYYNFFLGILGQFFTFNIVERILWFLPLIFLSFIAVPFLQKSINIFSSKFLPFTFLILFLNTYFLMIVSGGQITVALAYALFPLAVSLFFMCVNITLPKMADKIWFFLILALIFAIDFRIACIFFLLLGIYFLYYLLFNFFTNTKKKNLIDFLKRYLTISILAGVVVVGINLFWLLPLFLFSSTSLLAEYAQKGWVEFLSFADFPKSFSLLHPNWPEGIFGKTYFMRPEFLLMPILAFVSLLFINELKSSRVKRDILFFALLVLIGTFLAKGSNPPFGGIYLWLFDHFPGWSMFRDSTKFYVLVALSYSVLIPFSVARIYQVLTVTRNTRHVTRCFKIQKYFPEVFVLLVTCYLLLLIRPAWLSQLGGTFQAKKIPREYLALKDFINNQEEYFRILWVPKRERFGFHSSLHPAVSAEFFATDSVCREPFCSLKTEMPVKWGKDCFPNDRCHVRDLSYFLNPKTGEVLKQMAVKYVIIPFDSQKELFIAERQYNPQQREEVEQFLNTIPWLKKIDVTDKIAVYETPECKDHFFVLSETKPEIDWQMINPTKYRVQIKNAKEPFELIFSETYDELWQAKIEEKIIPSKKFGYFNSFSLNQTDELKVEVEFKPQRYVYFGLMVSLFLLFILLLLLYSYKCIEKHRKNVIK